MCFGVSFFLKERRVADRVSIPRKKNTKQTDQSHILSLLCFQANPWIFFTAVSYQLRMYLAWDIYSCTSVQKGGISGMPECLEHTSVVTQLAREARENKDNLSVLWLDLANAYGSIPHKLVQLTLTKHHIPAESKTSSLITTAAPGSGSLQEHFHQASKMRRLASLEGALSL